MLPTQRTHIFGLILRTTTVNWLVFIMKTLCVCYDLGTEFVTIVEMNFMLPKAKICHLLLHCANSTTLGFVTT